MNNLNWKEMEYEVRKPLRAARCAFRDGDGVRCTAQAAIAVSTRSNGGGVTCYCFNHFMERGTMFYSTDNKIWLGKDGNGYTFSREVETMRPDAAAFNELMANSYIPTSDCTVDIEFKSPCYRGLRSMVKTSKTIQKLLDDGHMVIDGNCGTHLHIGHERYINYATMEILRQENIYKAIWKPLADYVKENPAVATKIWGRPMGGWASYPDWNYTEEHTNFVNVQHPETIEFRECFFANYRQYDKLCHLCKSFVEAVVSWILAPYVDEGLRDEEALMHRAEICGNKILNLYKKTEDKLEN